jgi:membrane protease YdiL (CAAX protease family)
MRRILLIALGYLVISQVVPVLLVAPFTGSPLIPTLVVGDVLIVVSLWTGGFFKESRRQFAPVTGRFLVWTFVLMLSCIFLVDFLMSHLTFLPDWAETGFDEVLAHPVGIVLVAVVGPVLEELVFRGIITRRLLALYRPWTALLLSAAIFAVIHINPAQMPAAFAIGLLFAWLYYRSHSLLPGILMHILNNSLAVWLQRSFPGADTLDQLLSPVVYYTLLTLAVVLFVAAVRYARRKKGVKLMPPA